MKKFLFLTAALGIALGAAAQATSTTKEIMVDGIKVIYKKTSKETVCAALCIRGGAANYPAAQQGIEPLTLNTALQGGTATQPRTAFREAAEKMGTEFYANAGLDLASMNLLCLKDAWDRSWSMFAEAALRPAMSREEFELQKAQMIAAAKSKESDPDAYLDRLSTEAIHAGTDYAEEPSGTAATLATISLEDAKGYHAGLLTKKRIYVVVVGNVSEADVVAKVRAAFGGLPEGTDAPRPTYRRSAFATAPGINDRQMATNYIMGQMRAPLYNSPDGPVFRFASSILADRFFVELRTKRSLSYAPAAGYDRSALQSPTAYLYISSTDPKQSLKVMADILEDVREKGFTRKEVADKKKEFLTTYSMTAETSRDQAQALASAEAAGDWRLFESLNKTVAKLSADDVNEAFRRYLGAITWTYLGDKSKVSPEDFLQLRTGQQPPTQPRIQVESDRRPTSDR